MNRRQEWKEGMIAGIPIMLGYLSVSFGIGILAVDAGMTVLEAVLLSASNVTSAGQLAGIEIIAASGSLIEMVATQFVINLRYALMALSLTQKTSDDFGTPQRLVASFGITDEIFALCASRDRDVTPPYMIGMIVISVFGWVLGTFLGAVAGSVLPPAVTGALGIMLYGMFLAIILPAARKDCRIVFVIAVAAGMSLFIHYCVPQITSGFSIIICGLLASALGALIFPIDTDDADGEHSDSPSSDDRKEAQS